MAPEHIYDIILGLDIYSIRCIFLVIFNNKQVSCLSVFECETVAAASEQATVRAW